MKTVLISLVIIALLAGCVKEQGKVPTANISSGNNNNPDEVVAGTDPLADEAWHLKNTGQSSFSDGNGTSGEDINLEVVHLAGNLGQGVKVAISDNGVQRLHPDLKGNELVGQHRSYVFLDSGQWRGSDPAPINYGNSLSSHGTSATGLIAALGWNGIGSRGVAPEASWAGFLYLVSYGWTQIASSSLAKELDQMDGDFDIFNYSYGWPGCLYVNDDPLVLEGLESGVTDLRDGKGAIYVQAAGNSFASTWHNCGVTGNTTAFTGNTNFHATLASPHKIIVGAVNADGHLTSYSTTGSGIWVAAPGGEDGQSYPAMITTDIVGCTYGYSYIWEYLSRWFDGGVHEMNPTCNYTNSFNGTSSAAPVVSGVVALMLKARPELTWRDVKHILAETSSNPNSFPAFDYNAGANTLSHPHGLDLFGYDYDEKWTQNAAGYWYSNWYGFGRINAGAAVQMATTYTFPLDPYQQTIWYDSDFDNPDPIVLYPMPSAIGEIVVSPGISAITVTDSFIIEAVQIKITTDHPNLGELAVHLISPSGTISRLLTVNNNVYLLGTIDDEILMMSNAFYGEDSFGDWEIQIYDGTGNAVTGNLINWKLKIHGH